jgi:hypothetical protein
LKQILRQILLTKWVSTNGNPFSGHSKKLISVNIMDILQRKLIFGETVVTKMVSATGNPFCGHMKK